MKSSAKYLRGAEIFGILECAILFRLENSFNLDQTSLFPVEAEHEHPVIAGFDDLGAERVERNLVVVTCRCVDLLSSCLSI